MARASPRPALLLLTAALCILAMLRPVDHDESQYVAAAVLASNGLPYRDFAYLQTPLQPLLFAPLAAAFGTLAWPGLRLVNALLAAAAVVLVYGGARRAGADRPIALTAALLFAACDIVLFSAAMARNDALPAALLAAGIWLALSPQHAHAAAFAAGLCLAAAAAAKISFALPALAYGLYTLVHREHRPAWVALGAVAPALLVVMTYALAPADFVFGVFDFPARAPADFYAERPFKLSAVAKLVDTLKFLALGPALLALMLVARARRGGGAARLLDLLIIAGLIAALLPSPTWRQYLLPILPPLFVRLGVLWQAAPPGRAVRIAMAVFTAAGLAPSVEALVSAHPAMIGAWRESVAIRSAMDAAGVRGPVATLSPQFLPATGRAPDRRFAAGPFAFRSRALVPAGEQTARHIVTPRTLAAQFGPRAIWGPAAVLVGGEGAWTSGDDRLDVALEDWAVRTGWRRVAVNSERFRLYVPPA